MVTLGALAHLAGRALSPKQFKLRYGASKRDTDKVTQLLRKRGLTIDEVSRETRSCLSMRKNTAFSCGHIPLKLRCLR